MSDESRYENLLSSHSFRNEKPLRRYKRCTALKNLARAITECEEINSDISAPVYISRLVVFGSVLRGTQKVGDLDLHVTISRKSFWSLHWEAEWVESMGYEWDVAPWSGTTAEGYILKCLKGRSPVVSLSYVDPIKRGWPHDIVFRSPETYGDRWCGLLDEARDWLADSLDGYIGREGECEGDWPIMPTPTDGHKAVEAAE